MRSFVRIMALFAALAYGAMPYTGMAPVAAVIAVPMAVAVHADHAAMDHGDAGHRMPATTAASDDDCPHQPETMAKGHCAACLTLAADIRVHDAGKPARGAEAPTVAIRLVSLTAAPLDPPPRA